jgi:hypothetical protein
MDEWKLHIPSGSNPMLEYRCGLVAGQRVALKKDLVIRDHRGEPTGKVNPAGEIWEVLVGITSDPVLWFRCPDGSRHTWDDEASTVEKWFQVIEELESKSSNGNQEMPG